MGQPLQPALLSLMLRDPADCPPAHRDRGTPCLHANVQGPGDPGVQLRAAALVKPAAHPSEWGPGREGGRATGHWTCLTAPGLIGSTGVSRVGDSYQVLSCFSSVI